MIFCEDCKRIYFNYYREEGFTVYRRSKVKTLIKDGNIHNVQTIKSTSYMPKWSGSDSCPKERKVYSDEDPTNREHTVHPLEGVFTQDEIKELSMYVTEGYIDIHNLPTQLMVHLANEVRR